MCNDFIDLNKACPKDPYPLSNNDLIIDSTVRCESLSFMDAFQGFHQIFMAEGDQEKTASMTSFCIFCFIVMPFGLKSAGATYQRLANLIFKEIIGKIVEVYVDDMVIKSTSQKDHDLISSSVSRF